MTQKDNLGLQVRYSPQLQLSRSLTLIQQKAEQLPLSISKPDGSAQARHNTESVGTKPGPTHSSCEGSLRIIEPNSLLHCTT